MKLILIAIDTETPCDIHEKEITLSLPGFLEGEMVKASIEIIDIDGASQSDILTAARSVRDAVADQEWSIYAEYPDAMVKKYNPSRYLPGNVSNVHGR